MFFGMEGVYAFVKAESLFSFNKQERNNFVTETKSSVPGGPDLAREGSSAVQGPGRLIEGRSAAARKEKGMFRFQSLHEVLNID
jgi:hypothetical protein